jgi:hypothetical protein
MDGAYLKDKPEIQQQMWRWMEEMQDRHPHIEFGWWGFMPCIVVREL